MLRRDLVRKVRQVGLLRTLKHGTRKLFRDFRSGILLTQGLSADPFDSQYKTETAEIVSVGALDIPDDRLEHAIRYEAVVPEVFYAILNELPIKHEEFLFIDIGCGKGRALLMASRFPFKAIIGVELSASLADLATRNIGVFKDRTQQCKRIEIVRVDAVDYELPHDKLFLFLYNPFDEKIMCKVVSNVERSLERYPRTIYIAYLQPLHCNVWNSSGAFQMLNKSPRWVLYRNK